jgi:predicted amidophosphoribosyltransferase
MPYCENCGAQVNLNTKFCNNCGAKQNANLKTAPTQAQPVSFTPPPHHLRRHHKHHFKFHLQKQAQPRHLCQALILTVLLEHWF